MHKYFQNLAVLVSICHHICLDKHYHLDDELFQCLISSYKFFEESTKSLLCVGVIREVEKLILSVACGKDVERTFFIQIPCQPSPDFRKLFLDFQNCLLKILKCHRFMDQEFTEFSKDTCLLSGGTMPETFETP